MTGPSGDHPAQVLSVDAALFSAQPPSDAAVAAASLPRLFRPGTPGAQSDVRVVHAASPSWPQALGQALDTAVRGILLTTPTLADAAAVAAVAGQAERTHRPVVVAMPFAYDAAIRDGLSRIGAEGEPLSFIDSVATVPDDSDRSSALGAALLAQLAAVRTTAGLVQGLTMNYDTGRAYSAVAVTGGITVTLAGLVSAAGPPSLRMDMVGARHRHTVCLTGPYAAPATFRSHGRAGTSRPPLSYESGLRSAWRNLHAAVTSAQPVRFGLRELALDLAPATGRTRPQHG